MSANQVLKFRGLRNAIREMNKHSNALRCKIECDINTVITPFYIAYRPGGLEYFYVLCCDGIWRLPNHADWK